MTGKNQIEGYEELSALVYKYLRKELSEKEEETLNAYLLEAPENAAWFNKIISPEYQNIRLQQFYETGAKETRDKIGEKIANRIKSGTEPAPVVRMRRSYFRRMMPAAASVLVLLSVGVYWWYSHKQKETPHQPGRQLAQDVEPGQFKARLTLDDGSTIILDSTASGQLATQGNSVIVNKDGQLVYNAATSSGDHAPLSYNTLSTPRGGQYRLVLPDGSSVWLNAASSIRYPAAFTGNKREVEITGEAYFEVSHGMPFIVHVNHKTDVEVLGTHFNINAYDDEGSIRTTLLEGRVKVQSAILKPGQQAVFTNDSRLTVQNDINTEEVIAWKNGGFYFNGADIQTVMRQVARWYDVDVVYEGQIPGGHFKGKPSRSATLSQMLKMLEYTGVKYSIQGKKIIIKE